jgi:hypothetical protein
MTRALGAWPVRATFGIRFGTQGACEMTKADIAGC